MRVLVIDDHPIVRRGLVQLLMNEVGVEGCSEAGNIASALAAVERDRPDAIVLDLSLGVESGLDFIQRLRARDDRTPILVLSMFDESLHAERVLRAGAQGYLMKESAAEQVGEAVRRIVRGERVISEAMRQRVMLSNEGGRVPHGEAALTNRELVVLRLIGQGHSTAEIAAALHRSVKTIDAHRESIKRKLGLRSAAELLRYATLWVERAGVEALTTLDKDSGQTS